MRLADGVEVASGEYRADGWKTERRIMMIRQEIIKRPKAGGKQLKLFKFSEIYETYRYSCLVANLTLPLADVWRLYRHRAEAENKIKELKYDFGFDNFCMRNFFATEAALNFVMLAYNLMSLFRHVILRSDVQRRLSTLHFTTF